MKRTAALLAALLAFAAAGCGGDEGAEPGAPKGAARALTLILDFQPNAVHAGIYTALQRGHFDDAGIDLTVREPGASTDAPKLLRAGRADLAILDIHDLAIARDRGARGLIGIAAVVQRPLAAVIAADADRVSRPADLAGGRIGVTGLPSDDAVVDAVLSADGLDPDRVDRVTIGFDSVAALSAAKVDAATAFWNAEGVELRRLGVPIRVFKVDEFGAPRYPELVLVATRELVESETGVLKAAIRSLRRGTRSVLADPGSAADDLLTAVPELDRESAEAQLAELIEAEAFEPPLTLQPGPLRAWAQFDLEHGIVSTPINVSEAFELSLTAPGAPPAAG